MRQKASPRVSISHSRRSASPAKPPMGGLRPATAGPAHRPRSHGRGGGRGSASETSIACESSLLRLDRSPRRASLSRRGPSLAARSAVVGSRKPGFRISDGPGQGKADRSAGTRRRGRRRAHAAAHRNADGPQPDEGAARLRDDASRVRPTREWPGRSGGIRDQVVGGVGPRGRTGGAGGGGGVVGRRRVGGGVAARGVTGVGGTGAATSDGIERSSRAAPLLRGGRHRLARDHRLARGDRP